MTAIDTRNEAMAKVDAAADDYWKEAAMESIRSLCDEIDFAGVFTTDDVWDKLEKDWPEAKTHEPKALGPVMARAAKLGYIRKTDQTLDSKREECHARPVRVWKVQIFSRREA